MDASPVTATAITSSVSALRVHKRKRSDAALDQSDASQSQTDACTTTSESSSDESDAEAAWAKASLKRRRHQQQEEAALRRELVGLRATVGRVEVQVAEATAKLSELRALVTQLVASREQGKQ